MKSKMNFSINELLQLAPFEFSLFYNMAVKDFKERAEEEERRHHEFLKLISNMGK